MSRQEIIMDLEDFQAECRILRARVFELEAEVERLKAGLRVAYKLPEAVKAAMKEERSGPRAS